MTSDEQLELLEAAVSLRVQSREVPERVRRALAATEAALVRVIGPLVRKRVAARLLGVSVQGLDRHVARGVIPTTPIREGSQRSAIATTLLVDLAAEQRMSSRQGLSVAIAQLTERYQRDADVRDAHNLTVAIHQIAAGRQRSA